MVRLIAFLVLFGSCARVAHAETCIVWTHTQCEVLPEQKPATLQDALELERQLTPPTNVHWKKQASNEVCKALKEVNVACDLNSVYVLTRFLAVYGKDLFKQIPSHNVRIKDMYAIYIGEPIQEARIANAVRRNKGLFTGGNLAGSRVAANWSDSVIKKPVKRGM